MPGFGGPMPYLVQMLLPVRDNEGRPFGQELFEGTRRELTERFGGVTAHMRAPAKGLWKSDEGSVDHDDMVLFEVMADGLDRDWWRTYRERLRTRFEQDELVVRGLAIEVL